MSRSVENAVSDRTGKATSVGRARWYRVGVILFLTYLVAYIDRTNIGVAAPDMTVSLGLPSAAVGVLLSAFFWGYVITQIPGGWVASHVGPKKVVVGALLIWGAGAVLTGILTSYNALLGARIVMGLAEGVVWPTFTVLIVNWYSSAEHGKAMNLVESTLPISSLIGAPLAGWMIATWDYHVMFIAQGIPAFVMAVVFWFGVGEHPVKDRHLSPREREYLVAEAGAHRDERGSFAQVLRMPKMWGLGVIYFLWLNGLYAFGLWVPSLLKEVSHRGIGLVGLLSAIPFVLATVSMYVNAWISDRPGYNRAWSVIVPMFIGGIALLVQHYVGGGLWINMVFLVVAGIGIYAAFGPWWAWAASQVPVDQTGPSMGLINLMGNFGGIVGPVVVALAATDGNISTGFYVLGIALLAAGVGALALRNSRGPQPAPVDPLPASATPE